MTAPAQQLTELQDSGLFHRPARSSVPARDPEPLALRRPPLIDDPGGAGMGFLGLIPLLGMAGSMTVMMLFRGSPFAAVGALMMIVTVIGAIVMLMSQSGKAGRKRQHMRDHYLEYLEQNRYEMLEAESDRRKQARVSDPLPSALPELVMNPHRLWERRRAHLDFLRVRIGTGQVAGTTIRLEGEETAGQESDPHLEQQLAAFQERFARTPEMPLTLPLSRSHTVSVVGPPEFCSQAIRNIVLQLTALHSPEDVQLAFVIPERSRHNWAWVRQLPHVLNQKTPTPRGLIPRIAASMAELSELLKSEIQQRYQVSAEMRRNTIDDGVLRTVLAKMVIIDLSYSGPAEPLQVPPATTHDALGITLIHAVAHQVEEPEEISVRVWAEDPDHMVIQDETLDPFNPTITSGVLAESDPATAAGLARLLAPLRLSHDSLEHSQEQDAQKFTGLLGFRDFTQESLANLWESRFGPDFLNVPIGTDHRGNPVSLDIKEAAQHGMGPHGLCVGATGSGKSELLRTLVLGLAVTHPPEALNLVLVDYKGGATFAPFAGIPHVSGIVTNLADDLSLVDRIYSSLEGEILRRQEVLKAAGNIASITEYRRAREQDESLPPMPHLFLVIDEFGELLSAQPDFIDLFMSIGRIGRSIGVHLLLSSQRLEAGKLRGLDTYLSYRLGLRTLSEAESRTVLDTTDAFHLPPLPGYGYLKVDTTVYERFKAGYVSGPLALETAEETLDTGDEPQVLPDFFYATEMLADIAAGEQQSERKAAAKTETPPDDSGPTVLSAAVDLMRAHPRVTDPIWLPPLPDVVTLDQALSFEQQTFEPAGPLVATVGLLDDPAQQWQGPWDVDLTRAGGHLAILGGPSSGKSIMLRTLALSLAQEYSPSQVTFFGIDLKGSGLLSLNELPHSAGMAVRTRREALRRTIEEVADILTEREQLFEDRNIDSVAAMRQLFESGSVPELDVRDVVLLVDGWGGLLEEFEELQDPVYSILTRGSGYGIHVIATATRWNEVRLAQQSFFGTRIELKLSDPADSVHGSKVAANVPDNKPGRGFDVDGLIGQVALPRLDDEPDTSTVSEGLAGAIQAVRHRFPAASPRTVRMLPPHIDLDVLQPANIPGVLRFGLVERDHTVRYLDLVGKEPHLFVLGDDEAGKTTTLLTVAQELMSQYSSEELVFAVFDPRRELQNLIPDEYLGGYATSSMLAEKLSAAVVQELTKRISHDPLSTTHTSWEGPRVVLLVDDYDVLTAGGSAPLIPFAPYLPMGSDIGFHAIVTRRVRGAARTMFEPFVGALREAGATTFLMDGDPSEGSLIGSVRPRRFPAGRGLMIRSNEPPQTVQVAIVPDANPSLG